MTAQTVSNAVARRQEDRTAIDFMMSKRPHLRAVLPKSVDVDAFVGTAAGALYANSTLMEYAIGNVDSLYVALMKCAQLGHMPGTDEFYLTPRKEKGRGKVLGIEGYRGVIERMYRSGAVSKVVVREVCANDKFRYVEGVDDKPVHEFGGSGSTGADFFARRDRGEMVGVYAYAELVTGAVSRVVLLTRDDVFAARDSGGYRPDDAYTPWNRMDGGPAHPELRGRSMWWKTGARRLEPWVPTSAEYRRESLRASASAAEHAISSRQLPELPPGRPVDTATGEVVDAEIVDDADVPPAGEQPPPPAAPASPPDPAGGTPGDAPGSDRHRRLVSVAQQHFKRLGYADEDRDARLGDASKVILGDGYTISSLNDLTPDELEHLVGELGKHKDRASLLRMLADGTVSGE